MVADAAASHQQPIQLLVESMNARLQHVEDTMQAMQADAATAAAGLCEMISGVEARLLERFEAGYNPAQVAAAAVPAMPPPAIANNIVEEL
jgi:hypothetical protein